MIVFKDYFKILAKNKAILIIYILILLIFTVFSVSSGNSSSNFTVSKPDITIVNNDTNSLVVNNFINYIKENANTSSIKLDEESIDDALYYGDIDAVIYIYDGYTSDYLNNKEKKLDAKFGIDASSVYAKMLIEKYLKISDIANDSIGDNDSIINVINNSLKEEATIQMDNTVNTDGLGTACYYFSFANYSILAICIYIISIIMLTFNKDEIKKRNLISSKSINSITKELYLGNLVFAFFIWLFVIIVGFITVGKVLFTINGLMFIFNSFIFMFVALGISFLFGTILKSKEAISGIVNVVALGSSFLCGSFLPQNYLPDFVLKFSKFLPSFWYIKNNYLIKSIENINMISLKPIIINIGIILGYVLLLFIITIGYNKKHVKK